MNITIVDDEKILVQKTKKKLEKNGYCVNTFYTCQEFFDTYSIESDLYIIDIGLPDGSGFDVIKFLRIKNNCHKPIIITSGYADCEKKIYGLDIGADDYLTKPVIPDELIARVKAQLRRKENKIVNTHILQYKNIILDAQNNTIKIGVKNIKLTKKELQLAELFILNIGKLISKNKIVYTIWNSTDFSEVSDNTINVTISNLRRKLGPKFKLKTKPNNGYILEL